LVTIDGLPLSSNDFFLVPHYLIWRFGLLGNRRSWTRCRKNSAMESDRGNISCVLGVLRERSDLLGDRVEGLQPRYYHAYFRAYRAHRASPNGCTGDRRGGLRAAVLTPRVLGSPNGNSCGRSPPWLASVSTRMNRTCRRMLKRTRRRPRRNVRQGRKNSATFQKNNETPQGNKSSGASQKDRTATTRDRAAYGAPPAPHCDINPERLQGPLD
jgi:hypothetical protein